MSNGRRSCDFEKNRGAMLRAMCGVKLMDKKITKELMEMLGLVESLEMIAKANAVRWYGHVLRREDGNILRKALDLEVMGKRRRGRPKGTWKRKVEEEVGVRKGRCLGSREMETGGMEMQSNGVNPATSVDGENTG